MTHDDWEGKQPISSSTAHVYNPPGLTLAFLPELHCCGTDKDEKDESTLLKRKRMVSIYAIDPKGSRSCNDVKCLCTSPPAETRGFMSQDNMKPLRPRSVPGFKNWEVLHAPYDCGNPHALTSAFNRVGREASRKSKKEKHCKREHAPLPLARNLSL